MNALGVLQENGSIPSAFSVYKQSIIKKRKTKDNTSRGIKKPKLKVNRNLECDKSSSHPEAQIPTQLSLCGNNLKQKEKHVKPLKLRNVKTFLHKKAKHKTELDRPVTKGKRLNQTNHRQSDHCLIHHKFTFSDNPVEDALKLFDWILAPVKPKCFFNDYWEKKALHIKRSDEKYYTQILNSELLDKIVRNNYLEYTRNVDVVCYENGKKEVYNSEGRATASALWDYYSNGCSIRILNPQTYCNKVHLLLSTLQEYFGSMVGANVYLTPPNSQGFAPHYDDIEAFVIQLEGRKHWKLYQPKNADILARFSSPNLSHEDIGDPFMELTLNAGEVLYFPRGTIHEGYTDQNLHSLHITVSVYQKTSYTDLLEHVLPNALKKASESDVEFRKGLPIDFLKHLGFGVRGSRDFKTNIETKVKKLGQLLLNYIDVDAAADLLGRKFMYDSMPPVLSKSETNRCSKGDGVFLKNGQVMNRVIIELDTRIRLLRYYCLRLVYDSKPKLYYNTENANVYHGEEEQCLEIATNTIPLIQALQASYPSYITVEELPMIDAALKMQCVSDLWEHGLIVTEKPLKCLE